MNDVIPSNARPHPITVRVDSDRSLINQHGETFEFRAGLKLTGNLSLTPTDGPMKIREFANPSFLALTFEFPHKGQDRVHRGLLTHFDLWFPPGIPAEKNMPNFVCHAGPVDALMDTRSEASYVVDGRTHTFPVKYIGCSFEVMLRVEHLLIRCNHYDPTAQTNVAIIYPREFMELLFLKAPKLLYDRNGVLEEVSPHDADHVWIE